MTKQKTAVSGQVSKDSLGDRMKMYESVSKTVLMKRTPVSFVLMEKLSTHLLKDLKSHLIVCLLKQCSELLIIFVKIFKDVYSVTPNRMRLLWCLPITKHTPPVLGLIMRYKSFAQLLHLWQP